MWSDLAKIDYATQIKSGIRFHTAGGNTYDRMSFLESSFYSSASSCGGIRNFPHRHLSYSGRHTSKNFLLQRWVRGASVCPSRFEAHWLTTVATRPNVN